MIKFNVGDSSKEEVVEVDATLEVDDKGYLIVKVNGVDLLYLTPSGTVLKSFLTQEEVNQIPMFEFEYTHKGYEEENDEEYYKIVESFDSND